MNKKLLHNFLTFTVLYLNFTLFPVFASLLWVRFMLVIFRFLAPFSFINNLPPILALTVFNWTPVLLPIFILYLLFRKSFGKQLKIPLFLALATLIIISLVPILTFKKSNYYLTASTPFPSLSIGIQKIRCGTVSQKNDVNWNFPENNSINVSTRSVVAVNFNERIQRVEGCDAQYENYNSMTNSEPKMLGGGVDSNYIILPPGNKWGTIIGSLSSFSPFGQLSNLPLDKIKEFKSTGSWPENKKIAITCTYFKSSCQKEYIFSFTTGKANPNEVPTNLQDEPPVFNLDPSIFAPKMYPGEIKLTDLNQTNENYYPTYELNLNQEKVLENPVELKLEDEN